MMKIDTPVGFLNAVMDDQARLVSLEFDSRVGRIRNGAAVGGPGNGSMYDSLVAQLADYFAGRRRQFDIPLAPRGTEFQLAVWDELRRIPFGDTISYAELAARIDRPRAVRAVGAANGANPIPVIVPCHRVIGANGSLTGYGGGIERKQFLLALEGRRLF
jgi:methylated-DNA-[protein]-cysteine S-methyltransferase